MIHQKLELTVTRHSAAKLRDKKDFSEGEKVVVYDNHRKLSYPAVVSEILGTNNYFALSDNGPKHVSSDMMSSAAHQAATAAPADDIDRNHNDTVVIDDDNSSVASDLSEDFDDGYMPPANIGNNNVNNLNNVVNQNRRGQRELMNLGQY